MSAEADAALVVIQVLEKRDQAELKAWKSLAGYKFYMFGYWAAAWVKYNALLPKDAKRPSPFSDLVHDARDVLNYPGRFPKTK